MEKKLLEQPESEEIQQQYYSLKQKLEIFGLNKARGAQIRARVKWIEEGEKNTKYFCNLEKARGKKKIITRLETDSGEIIVNQGDILKEQVKFYTGLYNQTTESTNITEDVNEFMNNEDYPKLSQEQSNSCEGLVTCDEISKAVYSMKNGSSPGCDGITVEFIKFFWSKIKTTITKSFNESFQNGELSFSQKKGVITLLHKGSERDKLSNWRPITLTNTDYKILAKTLAMRVAGVIHNIVNKDQVGYIAGRNISTVLRTIDDVIDYAHRTGDNAYILACDYMKAFDSISKPFLIQTFETFGFGPSLVKWVKVLFKGSTNSINHGGWISSSFSASCGIRQGCPFSPLSFVLAVEMLAIKIRNSTIKGIQLPNTENHNNSLKIKQLADDTTLFLKDKEDMDKAKDIIGHFSKFSGLNLNVLKTKALQVGRNQASTDLPFQLTEKIKILGVYFKKDKMAKFVEDNWVGSLDKLQKMIKNWSARDLSIHGKVTIVKTFLVSQFNFIMQSVGIPEKTLEDINRILYKFIWQRRYSNRKAFEKIKRKILQQDYDSGGIRMIDMKSMQSYFYLQWAGKIVNSNENWTYIPKQALQIGTNSKYSVLDFNCTAKEANVNVKNSFWKEVAINYLNKHKIKSLNDITQDTVHNQSLFNNSIVQYRNKMPFMKRWIDNGICKIEHIVKKENNRLLTLEEALRIMPNNRANTVMEFNIIINSIPELWKRWITEGKLNYSETDHDARIFDNKPKMIKSILESHSDTQTKPNAFYFWQRKMNVTLDEKIWLIPYKVTKEIRLRELQFKINHSIYPTNILLNKMKLAQSNKCSFCADNIDFIEHFFFECNKIHIFWKSVEQFINLKIEEPVTLDCKSAMFGISENKLRKRDFDFVNHVILVAKMSISIAKKTNNISAVGTIFENAVNIRNIA